MLLYHQADKSKWNCCLQKSRETSQIPPWLTCKSLERQIHQKICYDFKGHWTGVEYIKECIPKSSSSVQFTHISLKETCGAEMASQWSHFHVHRMAPIQGGATPFFQKVPVRSHFGFFQCSFIMNWIFVGSQWHRPPCQWDGVYDEPHWLWATMRHGPGTP